MNIKFEFADEPEDLEFKDVEVDQFFIDDSGNLCQKVSSGSYNTLASQDGFPLADHFKDIHPLTRIKKVFPRVEKITV